MSAAPVHAGPLVLLARGVHRLSRGRVRLLHYRIVAQPVPALSRRAVSRPHGIVVERVRPGHPLLGQFPHRPDALRRRFEEQAVCHAAHRDGELVGYLWLQETPFADRDAGCRFVPAPAGKAAWDYDLWIAPAWRMSRAFQRLWDEANAWLRARGIGWTLSCVHGANRTSLASHRRLGATHISHAWILRIGERQLAAFTQAPFVDLCVLPGARTTLVVRAPSSASVE
jgi:GNAT superfamily N-acetyltransferase